MDRDDKSRDGNIEIAAFKEFPHAGSLISYGRTASLFSRRAAAFAGKILKGSQPQRTTVENPTRTTWSSISNCESARAHDTSALLIAPTRSSE